MTHQRYSISHQEVICALDYSPETGVFTWKKHRQKCYVGKTTGEFNSNGYFVVRYRGVRYLAHRLAWFYVHGEWPEKHLDHINGDCTDNRIGNLRPCAINENAQNRRQQSNNTSGYIGVSWHKVRKMWRASINYKGKHIHLGNFETKELAHDAYLKAKRLYHTFEPDPLGRRQMDRVV